MNDPVISPERDVVTLINVFTVAPQRQEELIRLLVAATEAVMQHQPGFVSASIHAGEDGTRVTNYAKWTSSQAYQAMLTDPSTQTHMGHAAELAESFDPHLYRVRSTHLSPDVDR